jgi:hypothetical protein
MKFSVPTGAALAVLAAILPAFAADDDGIARMALCRDSWFEWQKTEPAKLAALGAHVRAVFSPKGGGGAVVPKGDLRVAGLKVIDAYPNSVGMGVGFSLDVDATFDDTRKAVEKALGKTLTHCETSDGMRDCELEIAKQRSVMLMAEDKPGAHRTLIGCYYFYEK